MRSISFAGATAALVFPVLALVGPAAHYPPPQSPSATSYFGFDRNDYPGDDALPALRKSFSFTGYWLGPPPGEKRSSWLGKREFLKSQGFGFLLLYLAPDSSKIKNVAAARQKGIADAQSAGRLGTTEGFAKDSVIFLDIEEGGRLPASYHAYLGAFAEELTRQGFRTGVYASAIPVDEGQGLSITTAADIVAHNSQLVIWAYNDACPPSPGCNPAPQNLQPAQSGFVAATFWQYAQSPRRKEFTAKCPANYGPDNNCYAPADTAHKWFLDLNVSNVADPSAPKK
jgi:Domain of unknown function (DUF1906)